MCANENDMAHGEWTEWYESIGIDRSNANKFIRVFDELDVVTLPRLGIEAPIKGGRPPIRAWIFYIE